jgi:GntR family transcriptional regulator / MocR family aminotransferase
MTKRATSFELAIGERKAGISAHRWFYGRLREEILDKRLRPGARLPSTRDLASQHGLSRGTIVNAIEQLKSEGYVQARMGSGTYVSRILPEELLDAKAERKQSPRNSEKHKLNYSEYGKRVELFSNLENRPSRAFRCNMPALDLFPATLWAQVAGRRLRRLSRQDLLGCEIMGYRPLREALADYLNSSRGVNCEAGQIAIVSGVQEAIDLVARMFVNAGDWVCMEDPGYAGAAAVFEAAGAKICSAGVDEEGMKLEEAKLEKAKLVYVTPGHQFPLGITMSLRRRMELLERARKKRTMILEDDYDSEYRYSGRPVPALQGLDQSGRVLFAGSFSKTLFPSLRLGYLVVPTAMVDGISAIISVSMRHAPVLEQAVLCDFITEGHFGRHLRSMRQVYAERRGVLIECAQLSLTGLLEISGVEAGLQTAGWLCEGIDGESAAVSAAKRDVEVVPLSIYARKKMRREGLQLGFAAVNAKEIRRGVGELAIALEGELKAKSGGRAAGTGTFRVQ